MDDCGSISIMKIIEFILSILALVFLLIESVPIRDEVVILTIIAVCYLALVFIMSLLRRYEISSAGSLAFECALGLLLLVFVSLQLSNGGQRGMTIAAYIIDMILAILFILTALF